MNKWVSFTALFALIFAIPNTFAESPKSTPAAPTSLVRIEWAEPAPASKSLIFKSSLLLKPQKIRTHTNTGGKPTYYTKVSGTIRNIKNKLLLNQKKITLTSSGKFEIEVPLDNDETRADFTLNPPKGNVISYKLKLTKILPTPVVPAVPETTIIPPVPILEPPVPEFAKVELVPPSPSPTPIATEHVSATPSPTPGSAVDVILNFNEQLFLVPQLITQTPVLGNVDIKSVSISGKISNLKNVLLFNKNKVLLDEKGNFKTEVVLVEHETLATFKVKPRKGNATSYTLKITIIPRESSMLHLANGASKITYSLGLSETMSRYQQTRVKDLSQWLVTLKFAAQMPMINPNWSIGVSSYVNLIPLPQTESRNLRFLGLNFRMSYLMGTLNKNTRFFIASGLYYATSFSTTTAIGFRNLYGVQLYPTLMHQFENGHSLIVYIKYSPVNNSFAFLNVLENREIALGGIYNFLTFEKGFFKKFGVAIDLAKIDFTDITTKVKASAVNNSIGVVTSF